MNNITYVETRQRTRREHASILSIALIAALSVGSTMLPIAAQAQSTIANIFGQAPAGETITATSSAGLHRHGTANAKGHYTINSLPAGDYTVTLEKDGQTVDTRSNVALVAGRGAEVDFACPNDQCATGNR
jgi:hypothetical protein